MARKQKAVKTPEVLDIGEIHQETKRGAKGRWLPGVQPVGAQPPVVVGETRETIIEALKCGATTEQAAKIAGVDRTTIWRTSFDDEELKETVQQAIIQRRRAMSESVGEVTNNVLQRLSKSVDLLKPGEVQQLATAVGILTDKEASLAGIATGQERRVRLAVSDKVLALEVT